MWDWGIRRFPLDQWWAQLAAGRTVVTNGPLLVPRVNGQLPGSTLQGYPGEPLRLSTSLTLHTRSKIDYLQFIQNGSSVAEIRLDAWTGGRLPEVVFEESGWLVVRAVANHPDRFEAGWTAPFFVQFGESPRISRSSVTFFQEWLEDSRRQLQKQPDSVKRRAAPYYEFAKRFWQRRLESANAP